MAGPLRSRSLLAGVLSAGLAALSYARCKLATRCTVESRSLQYEAKTRAESRVGTGFLELSETRGAENAAWVIWHVRVEPLAALARTVVLREGPTGGPGRVLYEFPLLNSVPASGVVTQVFVRTTYAGQ